MLADFNVSFDRARVPTPVGGTLPYMAPEHYLAMFRQPGGRVDSAPMSSRLGWCCMNWPRENFHPANTGRSIKCRANWRR